MSKVYVERDALIEWLDKVDGIIADGTVEAPTLYKQVITDIKQLPAADVEEVKHGRWEDANGIRKSKCGHCKVEFGRVMGDDCYYCPTCGAKMDGGANNG